MAHRHARRKVVELHVSLTGPEYLQQPAKVRNISLDGVFIETTEDSLPAGVVVSVNVPPVVRAGALRVCRLEALVVAQQRGGRRPHVLRVRLRAPAFSQ